MGVRRLLIVGWDGAEPSIVESLRRQGRLPVLEGLIARGGHYRRLRSTVPSSSLPAWTSVLTGVNPGRHGLVHFVRKDPSRYRLQLVSAHDREAPTLFDVAHRCGLRSVALGIPGTYPPDKRHVCIAGFDSPFATTAGREACTPPGLHQRLRARGLTWPYGGLDETAVGPGWHRRARNALLHNIRTKTEVAELLLEGDDFDLAFVVFSESDTAAHHFWAHQDRGSPRHRPGAGLATTLEDVYQGLDDALGRLLSHTSAGTSVVVLSDHGAGGTSDHVFCLNRWLASRGWLRFRGARGLAGRMAGRLQALAAKYLPAAAKQAVCRGPLAGAAMGVDALARFGGLDLAGTLAFSDELPQYPGIWIHVRGRDPLGLVEPGPAYEELRSRIQGNLQDLRDPAGGRPVAKRVWRREEVLSGPHTGRAPDLLVELADWDGYTLLCEASGGRPGPVLRRLGTRERIGSKGVGVSGAHRDTGILVLGGRDAPVGSVTDLPRLEDLFPTFLDLLGLAAPRGLDGSSLVQAPEPGGYTPAEEEAVVRRLRNLGYL